MLMIDNIERNPDLDLFMTGKLPEINEQLVKLHNSERLYKVTGLKCHSTTDGPKWTLSWRLIQK